MESTNETPHLTLKLFLLLQPSNRFVSDGDGLKKKKKTSPIIPHSEGSTLLFGSSVSQLNILCPPISPSMAHRFTRAEKGKGVVSPYTQISHEPIQLPKVDTSTLIAANRLTLISRVTNPVLTKPKAVVAFLPLLWLVSGKVIGKELSRDKFQLETWRWF